jgi:hypothetical protein
LLWNTALLAAGLMVGQNYREVEHYLGPLITMTIILLVGLGAIVVVRAWSRRRAEMSSFADVELVLMIRLLRDSLGSLTCLLWPSTKRGAS